MNKSTATPAWLMVSLIPLSIFITLIWALEQYNLPWSFQIPWVDSLGIGLAFHIDALSAQMLALITGIGTLIFIYAVGYLDHEPRRGRIFFLLPIFMMAMIGAVTADDVITLFLFWELTSITSFLLVGFNHSDERTRDSARQALLVTMGGGLAMLGGLLLLSQMAGSWLISEIILITPSFIDDPRLPWAIALILTGAFTKSAQFPFHFWLPNAMSAPTPVSAYLHSATMVKLGVYLMARFDPAFNDLLFWEILLITAGTITAIWAAVLTLRERDLKRILAYSTLSALGIRTLLIGLPGQGASLAFVTFLFAHALYKAPLFMVAGNIDHTCGTRIIDHLMGLRRIMPWTATIAALAGISMAGLPLAYGFVAKDLIGVAKADADIYESISYGLVFVSGISAAVAGVAAIRVFWGPLESGIKATSEGSWTLLLPPMVLVLIGLELEFFPDLVEPMLLAAANAIDPDAQYTAISTNYDPMQILSATGITLGVGVLLFLFWDRLHDSISRVHWLDDIGPEASYGFLLNGIKKLAGFHTRIIQNGRLDYYLAMTLVAILLMVVYISMQANIHLSFDQLWSDQRWPQQAWGWLIAAAVMITGSLAAATVKDRLAALMASGMVGFGAALLFLFAAAPDLAFTQFIVEVALVVIAATLLPQFIKNSARTIKQANTVRWLLAISTGIGTLFFLLIIQSLPENRELANWFGDNSLSEAFGRNAVNVIIVDFRALDTLGEIAVVAFALIAALPLLKTDWSRPATDDRSPMLSMAARPIYWIMLIAAAWMLLRGHNEPGGGFVAGLTAVAASSLLAILLEPAVARRLQPLSPALMTLGGVLLAALAGLAGEIWGPGFLRHLWYGGISSVLIFDLGVMLTVWGALTGYIFKLLEQPSPVKPAKRSSSQ
jgi:multicomponent Na+:H+ antiporter subunit A